MHLSIACKQSVHNLTNNNKYDIYHEICKWIIGKTWTIMTLVHIHGLIDLGNNVIMFKGSWHLITFTQSYCTALKLYRLVFVLQHVKLLVHKFILSKTATWFVYTIKQAKLVKYR